MIKTFADKHTLELFTTRKSSKLPATILERAVTKLDYVHYAAVLDDLKVPPGNRLHQLTGDRAGQYSISVNMQWRICFRFEDGHAYDVEICDYH